MRCFIAIPIPEAIKTKLSAWLKGNRKNFPPASWVKPENYHLTLKFLGEVEETALEGLFRALEEVLISHPPGTLMPQGGGCFPHPKNARVLFYGFYEKPLLPIVEAVETTFEKENFPREKRAFRAHLTLARIRKPWKEKVVNHCLEKLQALSLPPLPYDKVLWMRSTLTPQGAIYESLKTYYLEPTDA